MNNWMQVHFTLGPVQGFVAQARRTRDLWAGSFLLSYLVGHAMRAVLEAGGEIVFPTVHDGGHNPTDPLLAAICRTRTSATKPEAAVQGPSVGSLPNRFLAKLPTVVSPERLANAVLNEWMRLAEVVWETYVARVAGKGNGTREIWNRQVQGFWDIAWVATPATELQHGLLDQRKNWRTHVPTEEPGDKCTIMGNLQELSGYVRSQTPALQDEFWDALRSQEGLGSLELEEDERLSAIALIKRLFPLTGGIGWTVPTSYPSTVYLAAAPWVAQVCQQEREKAARYGAAASEALKWAQGERQTHLALVADALSARGQPSPQGLHAFAHLDANLYHADSLANHRLWQPGTEAARRQLGEMLKELTAVAGAPPIYYALLLMDGDSMGALLRVHDPAAISTGLARFTERVKVIVPAASGQLVYAGGDDVLALFPLPHALDAAARLRHEYQLAMAAALQNPPTTPTISGAIVYAHAREPLKQVLGWAHTLLKVEAKERTQRDALALGVWQGGGPTLHWTGPWSVLLPPAAAPTDPTSGRTLLHELVELFSKPADQSHRFSSRFFYKIRERFELLANAEGTDLLPGLDPVRLLVAEYLQTRRSDSQKVTVQEATERVQRLMPIARRYRRPAPRDDHKPVGPLCPDGPLLVRFLAGKGVES